MNTLAVHVVWTTYATWLPGDARGHWSPLFDFYGHLVAEGHRLNIPDRMTSKYAFAQAKEPERILSEEDQQIVAETIGEILRTDLEEQVEVYAAAIERTHVHLFLNPASFELDRLIGRIKGRTSSAVIRFGSEPCRTRTWTTGYWKVFILDPRAVPPIQEYIENHNARRGLPPAPFSWITRSE